MPVRPVELFNQFNAIFESNICLQLVSTVPCYHMGVGDSEVEKGKKKSLFLLTIRELLQSRVPWIFQHFTFILCAGNDFFSPLLL